MTINKEETIKEYKKIGLFWYDKDSKESKIEAIKKCKEMSYNPLVLDYDYYYVNVNGDYKYSVGCIVGVKK